MFALWRGCSQYGWLKRTGGYESGSDDGTDFICPICFALAADNEEDAVRLLKGEMKSE